MRSHRWWGESARSGIRIHGGLWRVAGVEPVVGAVAPQLGVIGMGVHFLSGGGACLGLHNFPDIPGADYVSKVFAVDGVDEVHGRIKSQ